MTETSHMDKQEQGGQLTRSSLFAFALPTFAVSILITPVHSILPPIYAKYTTVTLSMIGTIFLLTRIFDAVTDPLIGYLSDRTSTRWGPRKPWISVGTVLSTFSAFFLFTPEPSAGFYYFLFWSLALYFGWTMIEIPYQAWATELSPHYRERTRIFTYRSLFGMAGALLFLTVPLLPNFDTSELTPEVFSFVAYGLVVLLPALMLVSLLYVPHKQQLKSERSSLKSFYKEAWHNQPFRVFIIAYVFSGFGSGVHSAALFFHLDSYLGLGDKVAYLLPVLILASFIAMPGWLKIMNIIGRHRAWALGAILNAIVFLSISFIRPGADAFLLLFIGISFLGFSNGIQFVAPPAMLGDIIDYDELKHGERRSGNYFALYSLIMKFNAAIGGALGFFVLNAFGFDPKISGELTASMSIGILLVYGYLPCLFFTLAGLAALKFPLNEHRHSVIQRGIKRRQQRPWQSSTTALATNIEGN